MRRIRHSTGYVRKQRGKWIGAWYVNGERTSKSLGLVGDLTKSDAKEKLAELIKESKQETQVSLFKTFVKGPYYGFYKRRWKGSTKYNNVNRIDVHLVDRFAERDLASVKRDELQDFLDEKAKDLSFSVVDHLRWDLKQIFDMALADGLIKLHPATLLFTPKTAKKPRRRVMELKDVAAFFGALGMREGLIAKLAILAGMRPGEIFALTWGQIGETFADVTQRIYRGEIDDPKTEKSFRQAAISSGLMADLEIWRERSLDTRPQAWVFPSEKQTPLRKDNVWRRNMKPKLQTVGLGWANFQVMRRTHSTLMKAMKADPKLVADQLGHSVDVNQNVYTQTPVEARLPLVNELERNVRAFVVN